MAAGNTYSIIASQTVPSNTNVVTISSIPNTYTDIIIVAYFISAGSLGIEYRTTINNDTAGNYAYVIGSKAVGGYGGSGSYTDGFFKSAVYSGIGDTAQYFQIDLFSYTNTHKKMVKIELHDTQESSYVTGQWQGTNTINRVDIATSSGLNQILAGSVITVYGIAAA